MYIDKPWNTVSASFEMKTFPHASSIPAKNKAFHVAQNANPIPAFEVEKNPAEESERRRRHHL